MATLERFNYYSKIILQYISTRFGIVKFTGFAILLTMLGADKLNEMKFFLGNFLFILVSLFVFRLLDDVWSYNLDKINHPNRIYIPNKNIGSFILITIIVAILYQIILFFISTYLGFTILFLLLISNFLYSIFYRNKNLMTIIPLIKYPVLLWCILRFDISTDAILLSSSAFFMMLVFDINEDKPVNKNRLLITTILLFVTGFLMIQPWNENENLLVKAILLLVPFIIFILPVSRFQRIFPVLIFPALHVIDLII